MFAPTNTKKQKEETIFLGISHKIRYLIWIIVAKKAEVGTSPPDIRR